MLICQRCDGCCSNLHSTVCLEEMLHQFMGHLLFELQKRRRFKLDRAVG